MSITIISIILLVLITVFIGAVIFYSIKIIPQGEQWVIERLGRYSRTLSPGIRIIVPVLERVVKQLSTKDTLIEIAQQEVITNDNVGIKTDAVAFIKVTNAYNAVYGVNDYEQAIKSLIQTTLRSIIGKLKLDDALSNRENIKKELKEQLLDDTGGWGVTIKTVEIKDIIPSESMQKAMEKQATAERERRSLEILAEGQKAAAELKAKATAEVLQTLGEFIPHDKKEMILQFMIGENYIDSLQKLSSSENSKLVVYPADLQHAINGMLKNITKQQ